MRLISLALIALYFFRYTSHAQQGNGYKLPDTTENLHYTLTCNKLDDIVAKEARDKVEGFSRTHNDGNTHLPCASILKAEYLNPKILVGAIWDSKQNQYRTGPAKFITADLKYDRARMKDCCPSKTCNTGCFSPVEPDCVLWIWNGDDKRVLYIGMCDSCIQIECVNVCKNGQYVAEYSSLDLVTNQRDRQAVCTSCPPGTFNTCTLEPECTW
jgi:hypothetical protein